MFRFACDFVACVNFGKSDSDANVTVQSKIQYDNNCQMAWMAVSVAAVQYYKSRRSEILSQHAP